MSAQARRRAIVAGGSIAGLLAGLALWRRDWDVLIVERSSVELTGRGAGIVTQPQLIDALRALGVEAGDELGIDVSRRRTLGHDGQVVAERTEPQVATSWNTLFDLLRAAFPAERYRLGADLVSFAQGDDGVAVDLADGRRLEADLLVGADGFRSVVRGTLLPDVVPAYAGYVAWRGLLGESELSPRTHADIFGRFAFGLPPEEQILGYPVPGPGHDTRPGHRRYNFVWYRPADPDTDLPRLLTDETGRLHRVSIPPPLIARAVVAEMRDHAAEVFAPQFAEIVRRVREPFLQPIYDLETPGMAFGRAALVGDAAFVARPHVGAGTAKAAEDAAALARCLDEAADVPEGLRAFEAVRLPVGRKIAAQARKLGTYMQRDFPDEASRQRALRFRSPEAVMAETALLKFLEEGSLLPACGEKRGAPDPAQLRPGAGACRRRAHRAPWPGPSG